MNNKDLYKEELLWQEYCRDIGLERHHDIDDYIEEVGCIEFDGWLKEVYK